MSPAEKTSRRGSLPFEPDLGNTSEGRGLLKVKTSSFNMAGVLLFYYRL
ncbi:MAG: hypothetical protein A4E53_03994 [Pelotomaculum sp. PtaB.Bin104]|nr:MAG: hypothetical protein A4E53_03994 [Pelotomaculum sp. PtaB.Bin104]